MSTESRGAQETPSAAAIVRATGVVFGGPLLLDALEVLGPVSAIRRWPQRVTGRRVRTVGRWLTVAGLVAPVVDHGLVRPWLRQWGSTPEEQSLRLPGDPDSSSLVATRAVTVRAPATEVWQWLMQIGQDRGGFYSYDWLENLAGCRLSSAEEVHGEWQDRRTGDPLTMFPGYATPLTMVDPPHVLVIENWGAYVVEPIGHATCRLIARSHTQRDLSGLFYVLLVELPHAIMERKMLLGIKKRAERRHRR